MRAHIIHTGQLYADSMGLGDAATDAACSSQPVMSDSEIVNAGVTCGLAYSINNSSVVSKIYQSALEGMAAAGTAVATIYGYEVLIGVVAGAVAQAALASTVTLIAAQVLTTIGLSALAGTAAFPILGTIVGLIVGAIIAFAEIVGYSCNVQTTSGITVNCDNYVGHVQVAANWLQNANTSDVVGMTPKKFADQPAWNLFLANPIWLYNNQSRLGISQPPPPDASSDTGKIYRNYPGAFELLNKVHLALASHSVSIAPSQLSFWKKQIPGQPSPDPAQNWQPGASIDVPSQVVGSAAQPVLVQPGEVPIGVLTGAPYESCPNLIGGVVDTTTPGVYLLQVAFPSLTWTQCELIFNAVYPSQQTNVTEAIGWANTQCTKPDPSTLGPGSQWNLPAEDVQAILLSWTGPLIPCVGQPGGALAPAELAAIAAANVAKAAGTSKTVTTLAVATVGAGALGVLAYAHVANMSFAAAAAHLGSKAISVPAKLAKTVFKPRTRRR
jgi:hypothetical protein